MFFSFCNIRDIARRQPARSATWEIHPNTSSELPSNYIISQSGGVVKGVEKNLFILRERIRQIEMTVWKEKSRELNVLGFSCVARLAGFEPATYRFVAGHSIH